MKVLIVAGGYLPGYKYGGPVRSLAAMVEQLGDAIDFFVITSCHDLGDLNSYPDVVSDSWNQVGKARVWYSAGRRLAPWIWRQIVSEVEPDVIYLNSYWSSPTSAFLFWQKLRILPKKPVILAPRGEFAFGALGIKSSKKLAVQTLTRWMKLYDGVFWQASSDAEASDIRRVISDAANVVVAPDLTFSLPALRTEFTKEVDVARFIWLGRVAPVKNLAEGLRYFRAVSSGRVVIDAYGPLEDPVYWQECQKSAKTLPSNIEFAYRGELNPDQVPETLAGYHFMFSSTLGENFGHTIAEALDQGLPVLLSNQTPWRDLEQSGVGWDISLDDDDEWTRVLNYCVHVDQTEYQEMSKRCRGYVEVWMERHGGREASLKMFQKVAGRRMSKKNS